MSFSAIYQHVLKNIQQRQVLVGVVGLGYVGLPLAQTLSEKGFSCLGFDIDAEKTTRLTRGASYLGQLSDQAIEQMLARGFTATTDFTRLGEPDVILLCVPTPLTEHREPDLQFVRASAIACANALRPGQLVILESTTYPGTTRTVVQPLLEQSGLVLGEEVFLAYSPEREDPGNLLYRTATIPKVVGAVDSKGLQLASAFYEQVTVQVVPVSSAEVAEACKLLENTYRAVNIALVNEMKTIYDRLNIDIWEVIAAASSKPFGYQPFYPGPGLGGHCIPIDPFYLSWLAQQHDIRARFIELAGEVNTSMPCYVVQKTKEALQHRGKSLHTSQILLLGMAYKKDVDDPRESPGFALMELFGQAGATVSYNDPWIPSLPPMRNYPTLRGESQPLTASFLATQDAVVVVTDHSAYDWAWIVQHSSLCIDTRNATGKLSIGSERIVKC